MARHPPPSLKTVLLVDGGDTTRITTKWFLSSFGYAVECARNLEEALAIFDPEIHDIVITDDVMPGMTGVELAHVIKLRSVSTPVIMLSTSAPEDQSCIDLYVQRNVHPWAVKEAVDRLLGHVSA